MSCRSGDRAPARTARRRPSSPGPSTARQRPGRGRARGPGRAASSPEPGGWCGSARPPGPCIAIAGRARRPADRRADGAPWASQTGAMHACGHDVHLAALVAFGPGRRAASCGRAAGRAAGRAPAARGRASRPARGTSWRPGRSPRSGPARSSAVHLQHQLPPGTVAAAVGAVNASTDDFEIVVEGTGGHAGYPQLTPTRYAALCQIVARAAADRQPAHPTRPTRSSSRWG